MDTYQKLEDMFKMSYKNFINTLSDADKALKDAIIAGNLDGDINDERITFEKKAIPVRDLLPTQNEIGIKDTIEPILKKSTLQKFETILAAKPITIISPIITLNGKYIIDGHHRWSEVFLINPDGVINCTNMQTTVHINPLDVLKAVQLAIYSVIKDIPRSSIKGDNLLTIDKPELFNYIDTHINEAFKVLIAPLNIDIKELIWNNVQIMKSIAHPIDQAPTRDIMPQTTGSKNIPDEERAKLKKGEWMKPLEQGKINFLYRFKPVIKSFEGFTNNNI